MGVRRLQTFMEQHCPDSFYEVRIHDIADEYRRIHNQDPVIVVDGSCCFRKLYGELDWVCGGQYKEYVDVITNFIDGFERLGVKLILYFDGATQEAKRQVWINRRLQSMGKVQSVIDFLKAGYNVHQIDKDLYVLPSGAGNVMSFISSTRCMVRRSIKECDDEIISYAARNKCLAVLGQDSDYVIYRHGAQYYLSSEHLDISKMTTFAYDKFALARHLKLHVKDLPVFASLMGNDHISSDDLKPFHNWLTGRVHHRQYASVLTHRVAEFVQNLPRGNALLVYLQQLSYDVFRTPNRSGDLRKSILSYGKILNEEDCSRKIFHECEGWDRILSLAHTNYITMNAPSYVYNLLRGLPFEMSTALEDFQSALPPSAEILRLMRQRVYGVVLCESPRQQGSPIIVKEWCASGPQSLGSARDVYAVLPPDGSPTLLDLWQNDSSHLKVEKFKLMGWITSAHLFLFDLSTYPYLIIPAICILSYLYHDVGALSEWEVKVFATVVVEVQAMESKELSAITVSSVDVRGVQLATIFNRAITHFTLVNSVCGEPLDSKLTRHPYLFDGKLFQTLYLAGKAVPSTPQRGNLQHYEQICETVLQSH